MKKKHVVQYSTENAAYVEGSKMNRTMFAIIAVAFVVYWIF